ncbi:MAG: hypothetical protein ACLTK8_00170 [Paeniclostridium sp.]
MYNMAGNWVIRSTRYPGEVCVLEHQQKKSVKANRAIENGVFDDYDVAMIHPDG